MPGVWVLYGIVMYCSRCWLRLRAATLGWRWHWWHRRRPGGRSAAEFLRRLGRVGSAMVLVLYETIVTGSRYLSCARKVMESSPFQWVTFDELRRGALLSHKGLGSEKECLQLKESSMIPSVKLPGSAPPRPLRPHISDHDVQ